MASLPIFLGGSALLSWWPQSRTAPFPWTGLLATDFRTPAYFHFQTTAPILKEWMSLFIKTRAGIGGVWLAYWGWNFLWHFQQERGVYFPGEASIHERKHSRGNCVVIVFSSVQFSSVAQSCPTLCDPMNNSTSLSITNSWSSLRLMSIELVIPSSHLILCCTLLLLPSMPPSISLFQWVNSLHEVTKVLEFQLQYHPFQRTPRTDLL